MTIPVASRTILNGHLNQDKEADRCRAGSPKWIDNVSPKAVAREQVVQHIKAVREAMQLGQNPTMFRAILTKLCKRYKTKIAG